MRKPKCSERDAALGVLRDADQGIVQLSPEERDCLARFALSAFMDECLCDDEFSGVEATLRRTECLQAPKVMPTVAAPQRERFAGLRRAAHRTGRHAHAVLREARRRLPSRRGRWIVTAAVGAAVVIVPILALTGSSPRLAEAAKSPGAGLASACAGGSPGHAELVALQQTPSGAGCVKPGSSPALVTAAHHS
jgi:hypothetical protein